MRTIRLLACFLAGLFLLVAQEPKPATLTIGGSVQQALMLTAADLAKLPRATVKTRKGGVETAYEGVWLHEVLKKAGVPSGSDLRGKALTTYILAEAADGYQV